MHFFTFRRPPRRYIDDILNARQIAGSLWMVLGKRIGVLFPAGSVFSCQRHINNPRTPLKHTSATELVEAKHTSDSGH